MPVSSCGGGKFRIGKGRCVFKSRASATRAQRGFFASKGKKERGRKNQGVRSTRKK